jgi:endonuclease/exonuclease/phosphatase family metal-dependent hydrolase
MNVPASAPERVRLLAPYADSSQPWRDSWEVLHGTEPQAPTVGIHPADFVDAPACYDFVFLTADLAPRLRAHGIDRETTASDHQPVWVELAEPR